MAWNIEQITGGSSSKKKWFIPAIVVVAIIALLVLYMKNKNSAAYSESASYSDLSMNGDAILASVQASQERFTNETNLALTQMAEQQQISIDQINAAQQSQADATKSYLDQMNNTLSGLTGRLTDVTGDLNQLKNRPAPAPTPAPAPAPPPPPPAPAPAPPPPPPKPAGPAYPGQYISYGQHNNWVTMIQQQLANFGFSPGPIDGIFGPRTKNAVLSFQRSKGIGVDGIVGPGTWGRLFG
jgi:hypothetical protein